MFYSFRRRRRRNNNLILAIIILLISYLINKFFIQQKPKRETYMEKKYRERVESCNNQLDSNTFENYVNYPKSSYHIVSNDSNTGKNKRYKLALFFIFLVVVLSIVFYLIMDSQIYVKY